MNLHDSQVHLHYKIKQLHFILLNGLFSRVSLLQRSERSVEIGEIISSSVCREPRRSLLNFYNSCKVNLTKAHLHPRLIAVVCLCFESLYCPNA